MRTQADKDKNAMLLQKRFQPTVVLTFIFYHLGTLASIKIEFISQQKELEYG